MKITESVCNKIDVLYCNHYLSLRESRLLETALSLLDIEWQATDFFGKQAITTQMIPCCAGLTADNSPVLDYPVGHLLDLIKRFQDERLISAKDVLLLTTGISLLGIELENHSQPHSGD